MAHISQLAGDGQLRFARSLPSDVIPDRFLSSEDREEIAGIVDYLIGILDFADGDADLEGGEAEDDFTLPPHRVYQAGPGCEVSDPDFCAVERGDKTTHETFDQGCGSAAPEEDDDEPNHVPPRCPARDWDGMLRAPLLEVIELSCERHNIAAAQFGRQAVHDPCFVRDLRNGRHPKPETERKVRNFINQLEAA